VIIVKKDEDFTTKHPYITALLAVVIGGIFGITISLVFTGDFNRDGIYASLFSIIIFFIGIKIRSLKNKKK